MKGINDNEPKSARGFKKKNEEKRIRDLVEQQLEQERRQHRANMEKMQQDLNFMQEQLYEEQRQREATENELAEFKVFSEQMKRRHHDDSEVDSLSLDARNSSAVVANQNAMLQQNDPQRALAELKMDSVAFIRLPTNNKRKTQWSRVSAHLSGEWLVFYKHHNERRTSQPVIQIDTSLIHHARRVTSADIRSADEKQIPLIFQILYDTEPGASNTFSKRDSMTDLSVSFGSRDGDRSLWRKHDLVELTFHMPTNCDFCQRQLSHVFRPPPAVECKRCHMRFHSEHRDRGELPQCKYSFDATTARDLLVMTEAEEICQSWVRCLKNVIKGQAAMRTNNTHRRDNTTSVSTLSMRPPLANYQNNSFHNHSATNSPKSNTLPLTH
jgi:hypothetical protein